MTFIDEAVIELKAGDGGNGSAAMRREDNVPHGGPSGGDGGDGGSIHLVADFHMASLLDFKFKRHFKAERGEDGRNKDQYGHAGVDVTIRVPVGTVVYEGEDLVVDLDSEGANYVIAKGGIGGKGNRHFATPWNQAPTYAEPGTLGEKRTVRLELKLLADVGLLGYPSVGKSTFIAAISRARPKIADYPFTTLTPNLGVVRIAGGERTFIVADIPGLIEGASEGAGLGHQFLRHVERCRVLVHIVEATFTTGPDRSPFDDFGVINRELVSYAPDLADKPQIVVLNKCDAIDAQDVPEIQSEFAAQGVTLLAMSAATGEGVPAVLEAIWAKLHPSRK
ncbi:GTPase ObgE [soil metagenome]